MIKITPYYELQNRDEFQRTYLRMIAASTPFFAEDVLYDDPEGLACFHKKPKRRTSRGSATKTASLLQAKSIPDGKKPSEKLLAEAVLAEIVVSEYSKDLHEFLYGTQVIPTGRVIKENLRSLLLLRLPYGQIPKDYRFNEKRNNEPNSDRRKHEKALYEYVFRYEDFSQLRAAEGHRSIHELVAMLGVKVCPYCNRLFTTTVSTKGHRVRPQLDHFKNKRAYPFLALSINNLVPSCGVCNLLKLDKDDTHDFIYPYEEGFAEDLVFGTNIPAEHTVPALEGIPFSEEDFQIEMKPKDPKAQVMDKDHWGRIQTSKEQLHLSELYQSHRDYVAFLYRQRYILTKQLAQDLYTQFGEDLFDSPEEVEDVFALMHTDYAHWGDRPLAKLTHDILDEIEELYREAEDRR